MAWYNSLKDLTGDVAKIAPVAGLVAGGPIGGAIGSAVSHIPALGSAAEWLQGNGGKNALGLLQGVNAATTQRKSNNYATDALATQQGIWNANQPLRDAGRAAMLNPSQGIAARIAAVPRGANPYAAPSTPQLAPVAPPRLFSRPV